MCARACHLPGMFGEWGGLRTRIELQFEALLGWLKVGGTHIHQPRPAWVPTTTGVWKCLEFPVPVTRFCRTSQASHLWVPDKIHPARPCVASGCAVSPSDAQPCIPVPKSTTLGLCRMCEPALSSALGIRDPPPGVRLGRRSYKRFRAGAAAPVQPQWKRPWDRRTKGSGPGSWGSASCGSATLQGAQRGGRRAGSGCRVDLSLSADAWGMGS